jgi:hypothetical protein
MSDKILDKLALSSVSLALVEARQIFKESEHKNTSGTREIVMLAQIILEEKHRIRQVRRDEQNGN